MTNELQNKLIKKDESEDTSVTTYVLKQAEPIDLIVGGLLLLLLFKAAFK